MVNPRYEYTVAPGDTRRMTWAGLILTTLSDRRLLRYSVLAIGLIVVAVMLIIWGNALWKILGVLGAIGPGGLVIVFFRSAGAVYRSNQETYPVGTVLIAGFDETGYLMGTSKRRGLRLPFSTFRVTRTGFGYVRLGSRDAENPSACFVPQQIFPLDRVEWFNAQGAVRAQSNE